ncbi:hypothetical protein [Gallaecimonas pentaromativorans]|uniref:hypothetical protein n=1 Tax=Gallaecimonas pentaromativorans TaxID=584787 RepID=UPI0012EEB336|nr:hypothetical protein [Gallaecimonas pentaromativorans]
MLIALLIVLEGKVPNPPPAFIEGKRALKYLTSSAFFITPSNPADIPCNKSCYLWADNALGTTALTCGELIKKRRKNIAFISTDSPCSYWQLLPYGKPERRG